MSDSGPDLFRKEAMAYRGKTEPLNGLLRVTAPHEWLIIIGLGIALLAIVVWGFFGQIDRAVAVECIVAHPGERHDVISTVTGSIDEVYIQVGDVVDVDQPLAHVIVPDTGQHAALAQARARVSALENRADASLEEISLARVSLAELEAVYEESQYVRSAHAGTVTSSSLAVGRALTPGMTVARILDDSDSSLEAITYLVPSESEHIETGMEAVITPAVNGTVGEQPLEGEVTFVAERLSTTPAWIADFGLAARQRGLLVRMGFHSAADVGQFQDGDICSARIVLGTEAPIRLLNVLENSR